MLKHPHDTVIGLLIDAVDLIGGCVIFKIFPLQRRDVFTKRLVKYEPDLQPNMLQNYFAYRSGDINNSRCDKKQKQNTVLRRLSHCHCRDQIGYIARGKKANGNSCGLNQNGQQVYVIQRTGISSN